MTKLTDELRFHKKPEKRLRFMVSKIINYFLKSKAQYNNGLIVVHERKIKFPMVAIYCGEGYLTEGYLTYINCRGFNRLKNIRAPFVFCTILHN